MIRAEILKDSINSHNNSRLTTFLLTYPRFIHSEFLTHRMISKNSASSRAIPSDKIIQAVKNDPAMPEFWGKNQSGMQANDEMDDVVQTHRVLESIDFISGETKYRHFSDREYAKKLWLDARDCAISHAVGLQSHGLHKQIANRVLEPFFNITVLASATEWENFFALRAHKDAQPEFQMLANKMLEAYNASVPDIKTPRFDCLTITNPSALGDASKTASGYNPQFHWTSDKTR